jgi:hypothetical protein
VSREQTELRAERLRVILAIFGEMQTDFATAYNDAARHMTQNEHSLFQSASAADLLLGNACLEIAADLRRREWKGLEALLSAIPPGGDIETIFDLPAEDALPALRAAHGCGWLQEAAA